MSIKECYTAEQKIKPSLEIYRARGVKRILDVLLVLPLIAAALPFCLLIASLIKLTSKGPLFYASPRLGKGGKPFECWKFRTMVVDAEKKLKDHLKKNPSLQAEWQTYFKLKKDPRVTPIGKILRKTSLDELPQLWNVLKGDLSLVGPRPYLIEEIRDVLGDKAGKILSIRPGITGLWQVSGRNKLTFQERIRMDEIYVDQKSLLLDLQLLVKTIPAVFLGKGQ